MPRSPSSSRSSREGVLVVVAAAVVLALIAGVAWSAFRQVGGGAAPTNGTGPGEASQAETLEQTPSPAPDPEPTEVARSYSVEIPEGWREIPAGSDGEGLYLAKVEGGIYEAVVTVDTRDGLVLPLQRLPEAALRELVARNAKPTPVGDPAPAAVGGERAIAYTIRLPGKQQPLMERQVAFYREGRLFLVTFAAAAKTFEAETRAFERFLKSWRWK